MYMESDFYGITNASEERDYADRMEAIADARDAARAAERAAEALECAENDEAEERDAILAEEMFAEAA